MAVNTDFQKGSFEKNAFKVLKGKKVKKKIFFLLTPNHRYPLHRVHFLQLNTRAERLTRKEIVYLLVNCALPFSAPAAVGATVLETSCLTS